MQKANCRGAEKIKMVFKDSLELKIIKILMIFGMVLLGTAGLIVLMQLNRAATSYLYFEESCGAYFETLIKTDHGFYYKSHNGTIDFYEDELDFPEVEGKRISVCYDFVFDLRTEIGEYGLSRFVETNINKKEIDWGENATDLSA